MGDGITLERPLPDVLRRHIVRKFDEELAKLREIILEMGGRVEEQVLAAVAALLDQEQGLAFRVLDRESQIDYLSLDADEEVFRIIARRQPTAVDLRIVLALSKIAGEVERAGDKAVRVAYESLAMDNPKNTANPEHLLPDLLKDALCQLDDLACCMFERSIQAVAAFDVSLSLTIFEDEPNLLLRADKVRDLICESVAYSAFSAHQMAGLLACAQAMKRIGHHAGNIAEQVIYVALGQDVRYRNREILIETLHYQGY